MTQLTGMSPSCCVCLCVCVSVSGLSVCLCSICQPSTLTQRIRTQTIMCKHPHAQTHARTTHTNVSILLKDLEHASGLDKLNFKIKQLSSGSILIGLSHLSVCVSLLPPASPYFCLSPQISRLGLFLSLSLTHLLTHCVSPTQPSFALSRSPSPSQ